jgi:hypothetical protein
VHFAARPPRLPSAGTGLVRGADHAAPEGSAGPGTSAARSPPVARPKPLLHPSPPPPPPLPTPPPAGAYHVALHRGGVHHAAALLRLLQDVQPAHLQRGARVSGERAKCLPPSCRDAPPAPLPGRFHS